MFSPVCAQKVGLPVVGCIGAASRRPISARFPPGLGEARLRGGGSERGGEPVWRDEIIRIPTLVADFVRRRVAVIATPGQQGWPRSRPKLQRRRSRSCSASLEDPVQLVSSPASPDRRNATGINFSAESWASGSDCCISWCQRLFPRGRARHPVHATTTATTLRNVREAAHTIGLQSRSDAYTAAARSISTFATLAREESMPSSSQAMRCSPSRRVNSLLPWRRATGYLRFIRPARLPQPAD